jgi:hypothetical protein
MSQASRSVGSYEKLLAAEGDESGGCLLNLLTDMTARSDPRRRVVKFPSIARLLKISYRFSAENAPSLIELVWKTILGHFTVTHAADVSAKHLSQASYRKLSADFFLCFSFTIPFCSDPIPFSILDESENDTNVL